MEAVAQRRRVEVIYSREREIQVRHGKDGCSLAFPACLGLDEQAVTVVGLLGTGHHGGMQPAVADMLAGLPSFTLDMRDTSSLAPTAAAGEEASGPPESRRTPGAATCVGGSAEVEALYCREEGRLFLRLRCPPPPNALGPMAVAEEELSKMLVEGEFFDVKAVLFVFLVAQHVILVSEGPGVEEEWVRMLEMAQRMKNNTLAVVQKYFASLWPRLATLLQRMPGENSPLLPGRCTPSLSFVVFAPQAEHISRQAMDTHSTNVTAAFQAILAAAGEELLFTLEADNKVLVLPRLEAASPAEEDCFLAPLTMGLLQKSSPVTIGGHTFGQASVATKKNCVTWESAVGAPLRSFVGSLWGKERKNEGQTAIVAKAWYVLASALADLFIHGKQKGKGFVISARPLPEGAQAEFGSDTLAELDTLGTLVRIREAKAVKLASEVYATGLPDPIAREEHERRVAAAQLSFLEVAVGRGKRLAWEKVHAVLEAKFQKGNRRCEAVSVLGNQCILPRHVLPPTKGTPGLPCKRHTTGHDRKTYCNCGACVLTQVEPFHLPLSVRQYYVGCCAKLPRLEITPETKEWVATVLTERHPYSQRNGLQQPGLAKEYCTLVPFLDDTVAAAGAAEALAEWEFPSLSPGAPPAAAPVPKPSPKASARPISADQVLVSTDHHEQGGWVGYDYECTAGHRFILPASAILALVSPGQQAARVLSMREALSSPVALYARCRCRAKTAESDAGGGLAVLQRVYLVAPRRTSLRLSPRVEFHVRQTDGKATKPVLQVSGGTVEVPPGCFVALRTPSLYVDQSKRPLVQVAPTKPFLTSFTLQR